MCQKDRLRFNLSNHLNLSTTNFSHLSFTLWTIILSFSLNARSVSWILNTLIPIAPPQTIHTTYIQLRCKQYSQTRGLQPITVHCIFPFYSANAFVRNEHRQQRIEWYANSERRTITHWMSKRDFTQICTTFSYRIQRFTQVLLCDQCEIVARGICIEISWKNLTLLFRWKPLFNLTKSPSSNRKPVLSTKQKQQNIYKKA